MQYDILHYRQCCRTTMIKGKESWNYRVTQSSRCWVEIFYIFIHLLTRTQEESNTKRNFFFFSLFFPPWHGKLKRRFSPIFNVPSIFALSRLVLVRLRRNCTTERNSFVSRECLNVCFMRRAQGRRWKEDDESMKALQTWEKLSKQSQETSSSSFFILKRFLCCLLAILRRR